MYVLTFDILELVIHFYGQVQRNPLSFQSARDVRFRIESLPSVPKWQQQTIAPLASYKTNIPITLFWRNTLTVVQDLYRNPIFSSCLEKNPYKLYMSADPSAQVYSEFMSGDFAWNYQVCD